MDAKGMGSIMSDANGFTAKTTGTGICNGIEVIMVYTNIAGATISYSGF